MSKLRLSVKAVHQMPLWKAALAAFAAMFVADVIGTGMVIFESHFEWLLAGLSDVFGYLAGLACSILALDSVLKLGIKNRRSLVLIASITLANFMGTVAGVEIVKAISR